jgi:uncharacterized protein YkwD
MIGSKSKLSLFVFFALCFVITGCGAQNPVDPYNPGYETNSITASSEETNFLALINKLRADHGLSVLTVDPSLQASAKHHSLYQLHTLAIGHFEGGDNASFDKRIKLAGGRFSALGENVACGEADAESTFIALSNDPDHLAVMLNPNFQSIGISEQGDGSVTTSDCTSYFWTMDFGGNTN